MEDCEDVRLLQLTSTSSQASSDPSERVVRSQRNALLTITVSFCMCNVRELITKSDAGTRNFL